MRSPTWRAVFAWTFLGTALGVGFTLVNLAATKDTLGGLVAAVPGSAVEKLEVEEGIATPSVGGGHDGQQFYAIARNPLAFSTLEGQLDWPRYRMQRILFPLLSWGLHPWGTGSGLVWTMFGVLVGGLVLGGIATGVLTTGLGGPAWTSAIFAPLLGSVISLRITTPDALALALALLAIALSLYRRPVLATTVAVAAVLTREPVLLLLLGFSLWRSDRKGIALVAIPGSVAALWYLALARIYASPEEVPVFVFPFSGWIDAVRFWWSNVEGPLGFLSMMSGLVLAAVALWKTRPSHPLWLPLAVSSVVLAFYSVSILAPERNASRLALPIQVLSIVALTTRRADRRVLASEDRRSGKAIPIGGSDRGSS